MRLALIDSRVPAAYRGVAMRLEDKVTLVTAKAAAVNLTKSMALDLAPSGGRVNAICPAYLASDETRWVTGVALPIDGGATA